MTKESKERKTRRRRSTQSSSKSRKRGKQRGRSNKSFAVWQSVSLLPKISRVQFVSGVLFTLSLCYGVLLVWTAYHQLNSQLITKGVKRTYFAPKVVSLPLDAGEPAILGQLIDQRTAPLWPEMIRRFGRELGEAPPLIFHQDVEVNRGAWRTALRSRGIDFVESQGMGAAGEVSLIWPPKPAPSPTLIVGHYYDHIAWLNPDQGVILSPKPKSWEEAPSLRLSPRMSRRW